jgi:hypothetical protein
MIRKLTKPCRVGLCWKVDLHIVLESTSSRLNSFLDTIRDRNLLAPRLDGDPTPADTYRQTGRAPS